MSIGQEIRKYLQILNEDTKTKSKKPKVDYAEPKKGDEIKFADPMSKGELAKAKPASKELPDLPGKKSSADQTRQMQVDMPQGTSDVMRSFMNRVQDITDPVDVPADVEFGAEPQPTKPETLPATISKALSVKGYEPDVTWHEVKNLPGYAIEQIRGAFRPLFDSLMGVQLEDVSVATTLDPSTDKRDMKSLIGHIAHHGIRDDNFSLEAFDIDPDDYKIEKAYVYSLNGWSFLILQENLMGQQNYYVYSGPGRETRVPGKTEPEQIQ